jgi:hypothetical protein
MTDLLAKYGGILKETTNTILVVLKFNDLCLGGKPKNKDVARAHALNKRRKKAKQMEKMGQKPPTEAQIQEMVEIEIAEFFGDGKTADEGVEEQISKGHTCFPSNYDKETDTGGIYIETRQLAAMTREMMSTLGIQLDKAGTKQTRQHLMQFVACDENAVPYKGKRGTQVNFIRDGQCVQDEDDFIELTAAVSGPSGTRSIVKRHDYVREASIRFLVRVPADLPPKRSKAVIRDREIAMVFMNGQNDGIGACRSQQYGKFTVTRCHRMTDVPWVRGSKERLTVEPLALPIQAV